MLARFFKVYYWNIIIHLASLNELTLYSNIIFHSVNRFFFRKDDSQEILYTLQCQHVVEDLPRRQAKGKKKKGGAA